MSKLYDPYGPKPGILVFRGVEFEVVVFAKTSDNRFYKCSDKSGSVYFVSLDQLRPIKEVGADDVS